MLLIYKDVKAILDDIVKHHSTSVDNRVDALVFLLISLKVIKKSEIELLKSFINDRNKASNKVNTPDPQKLASG